MPGVPPARFGFLGPAGGPVEAAARTLPAASRADLSPYPSVAAALDAVRAGDTDGAVVPLGDLGDGTAGDLDELAHGDALQVTRELAVPGRPQARCVLVSRPGPPPAPSGADRTTVLLVLADDGPGALVAVLAELAVRGVSLTRIASRPGWEPGRPLFSLDCAGHLADAGVGEALAALRRVCLDVRVLGSYPRADGVTTDVRPGTTEADFRDAAAWLERLRAGS